MQVRLRKSKRMIKEIQRMRKSRPKRSHKNLRTLMISLLGRRSHRPKKMKRKGWSKKNRDKRSWKRKKGRRSLQRSAKKKWPNSRRNRRSRKCSSINVAKSLRKKRE